MSNGNAVERGDDGTDVDDLATLSKLDNQASLWLPSSHVHIIHLYTLKIGKKENNIYYRLYLILGCVHVLST